MNLAGLLWINKNNHQKQASPGVQFPNALLSGDYTDNLAQFKQIVKREFQGTIFQNTFEDDGNRLFSSRNNLDSEYMELAKDPEKNRGRLQKMVEDAAKEAGYTRLFYHGSKNGGGFMQFRDWQYFTENRGYAQRGNRDNILNRNSVNKQGKALMDSVIIDPNAASMELLENGFTGHPTQLYCL